MRLWTKLGAIALALSASSAQAEANGAWRVNGAIAGRTFVLDCQFNGTGGTCVDTDSKRSNLLTSLSTTGDQVAWSFKTKVAIMSVTLNFAGRIAGNRMSGTMRAAGRSGTFNAVRR